jgi:hypothetical protein
MHISQSAQNFWQTKMQKSMSYVSVISAEAMIRLSHDANYQSRKICLPKLHIISETKSCGIVADGVFSQTFQVLHKGKF